MWCLGFFFFPSPPSLFFLLKSMNWGGTSGRLKPRSAGTRLRIRRLQRLPAATLAAATKSCRDRLAQNPSSASSGKASQRAAGARGPHPAPGPVPGHASPRECGCEHEPCSSGAPAPAWPRPQASPYFTRTNPKGRRVTSRGTPAPPQSRSAPAQRRPSHRSLTTGGITPLSATLNYSSR